MTKLAKKWYARGVLDALEKTPTRFPPDSAPLIAHLSYVSGRRFGLTAHLRSMKYGLM